MTSVKIQLFSVLKSMLKSDYISVGTEENVSAGELLDAACAQYPEVTPYRSVMRLAVNHVYVSEDASVCSGGHCNTCKWWLTRTKIAG